MLALDNPSAKAGVTLRLAPLAVPLNVECAHAARDAIGAACRGWEGVASTRSAPLALRIETSPALSGSGHAEITVDGSHMTVRGPGVMARADVDEGSRIA